MNRNDSIALIEISIDGIKVCPLGTHSDNNMVYIRLHKTWYCIECQEKDLIWFPSHGSEEDRRQHNYINWYYEQKERFSKKYLNKDRRIIDK